MTQPPSRRRNIIIVLLLLIALLFLFLKCSRREPAAPVATGEPPMSAPQPSEGVPGVPNTATPRAQEVLTEATLQAPKEVKAGTVFAVQWTGPNNSQDYIAIAKAGADDGAYANYTDAKLGNPAKLTAPIESGEWELRYVAAAARKVLGRTPITVLPIDATLDAPAEAVLGTTISVRWTGPNNANDYITVVAKDAPEGRYGNYAETTKGSPLSLTMPAEPGDAELRYVTGQGARTLAHRAIKILSPEITLDAPAEVTAGSIVELRWSGPNNPSDYITLVPKTTPDGRYGNYTDTSKGSPLKVTAPIFDGDAEIRYMSGQGAKVLGRRNIRVVAAKISLEAPEQIAAGAPVSVVWTGPNQHGDYLTIVPKTTRDGQYGHYAETHSGWPVKLNAPKEAGEAEIRYVSGQGSVVLARRAIRVVAE